MQIAVCYEISRPVIYISFTKLIKVVRVSLGSVRVSLGLVRVSLGSVRVG